MKHKILFLTIITIFTTSNIFAQLLTFPNAEIFTTTLENGQDIVANDSIVFVGTNDDIYVLDKGELEFLREKDMGFENISGGCIGTIEDNNGVTYAADLSDVYSSEIIADLDSITVWNNHPIARKGDTTIFYGEHIDSLHSHYYINIGNNNQTYLNYPIDVSPTGGYIINNDTVYVYMQVANNQYWKTAVYKFAFDDMSNPEIDTIFGQYFIPKAFLDDNYFAIFTDTDVTEFRPVLHTAENGWQEIDPTLFGDLDCYLSYALSYYQHNGNKELLISGISYYGEIIQIYTAGLPSTENDILIFSFPEQTGNAVINSTNHTIGIEVANGTNLTNLVATFELSENATAFIETTEQESGTTENDFSNPVTYTIQAENEDMQEWTVAVSVATSVNQLSADKISIFPNPTSGKINIKTTERIENITVLDISGKIILETTTTKIDLSKQKTGIYFVKIETGNGILTEKIIIE